MQQTEFFVTLDHFSLFYPTSKLNNKTTIQGQENTMGKLNKLIQTQRKKEIYNNDKKERTQKGELRKKKGNSI